MNAAKIAAVVLGAWVLQLCLFGLFSFEGARPDVMVLVAVAAGFVAGPERGAIVGFAAGLSIDLMLATPLGLSALVYTLVGYLVGRTTANVVRASWWISPIVVGVGSAVGMVLYALLGKIVGQPTLEGPALGTIVGVVAVLNAILSPLAVRALRWAMADSHDRRRNVLWAR